MAETGVIYLLTNQVNGKKYVGQSTNLKERMRNHRKKSLRVIDKAIDKYSWSNFEYEIIEEEIPLSEIDEKEMYWISHYNTYKTDNGYNCTPGGNMQAGEYNPQAELSVAKAKDILEDRINHEDDISDVAERQGVSESTVRRIIYGLHWTVDKGELHDLVDQVPENPYWTRSGSDNHKANIDEEEAANILKDRIEERMPIQKLSDKYGRSNLLIGQLIQGEHWAIKEYGLQDLVKEVPKNVHQGKVDKNLIDKIFRLTDIGFKQGQIGEIVGLHRTTVNDVCCGRHNKCQVEFLIT